MHRRIFLGIFFSLAIGGTSLFASYQGQNPSPGFSFPIDGGRKITPTLDPQTGLQFSIGYLTVTSIDPERALNSADDQQNVNLLLKQAEQMYMQIYNKYQGQGGSNRPVIPKNTTCPQNTQVPSGCSQRRSPRWR